MIVFDLQCQTLGHRFEGWFASSEDFAAQQARGLVSCPQCGSGDVIKAPMAPAVPRKGNQRGDAPALPVAGGKLPPEAVQMLQKLAEVQSEALKQSRWVGDKFADVSRAIHYGDQDHEVVHGQATAQQAKELLDEGVPVMPLPFPVAPPDELN